MKPISIRPDLFCFRDTCNVYVLRENGAGIAIDFGSGRWLSQLTALGIRKLDHVFLTHHHADQCAGLLRRRRWPFLIHAPVGEEPFLKPRGVAACWHWQLRQRGYPRSFSLLPRGVNGIHFNLSGFTDRFWGRRRIRILHTPGHGPHAVSLLLDHRGQQVVFCGDAAHHGSTIWQPWHLEWDHWTGTGALAAWEGVQRLASLRIDLLCPSHGPVIAERTRSVLQRLADRLLAFYHAKGHICPGEPDRYSQVEFLPGGARRLWPHLFQFGENSYLLLSRSGEGFVVDPHASDWEQLAPLWRELGRPRITAVTATHYHFDHSDGLPLVKRRYGATMWLHPWVADVLRRPVAHRWFALPPWPIVPDRLWPESGTWRWNEYEFRIAPFPGQTWWHCAFQTTVDGVRVFFGGDNFQPASRWNGTGGFCAHNGSRFDGFVRSAKLVLTWKPDLLACAHGTCYRFHPSQFRKIIAWAKRAEAATRALCPNGNLETNYYTHPKPLE